MDALSNGKIAPFPFLIIAFLLIFVGIAGQIRDSYSYICANILILLSALMFIIFIVKTIL